MPATTSATVRASGPVALGTLATGVPSGATADVPCGAMALAFGSTICPKTIVSKLLFNVLLSKLRIVAALPIVTCAPFFTVVLGTAAHTSPSLVFSRR